MCIILIPYRYPISAQPTYQTRCPHGETVSFWLTATLHMSHILTPYVYLLHTRRGTYQENESYVGLANYHPLDIWGV